MFATLACSIEIPKPSIDWYAVAGSTLMVVGGVPPGAVIGTRGCSLSMYVRGRGPEFQGEVAAGFTSSRGWFSDENHRLAVNVPVLSPGLPSSPPSVSTPEEPVLLLVLPLEPDPPDPELLDPELLVPPSTPPSTLVSVAGACEPHMTSPTGSKRRSGS
jgi:hypothetical protein